MNASPGKRPLQHRRRVVVCIGAAPDVAALVVPSLRGIARGDALAASPRFEVVEAPIDASDLAALAAAASAADAMLVIADASRGLDLPARRALHLASLLGPGRIALVVGGLDACGDAHQRLDAVMSDVRAFATALGPRTVDCLAVSGHDGDGLAAARHAPAWYAGPTLVDWLGRDGEPEVGTAAAARRDRPAEVADQFEVAVAWLGKDPLLPGRRYRVRIGAESVGATFAQLKYVVDPGTLDHLAARTLGDGAIGVGTLLFDAPIAFDADERDAAGGERGAGASFVIVDRSEARTLGVGRLHFALRRSHNLAWQATDVDRAARTVLHGHRPCVVWFTGLSGAGKSTIANLVEKALHARGCHTYLLDGDNVRHGLNRDLGFTDADRVENIRRVAEVARLMADAGLIVLVSFISPFRAERRMARALVGAGEFCEVFVDAPLAVAEARDVKGLYAKARRGELPHFTGIDSPYEPPERSDVHIDSAGATAEDAALRVVAWLRESGVFA